MGMIQLCSWFKSNNSHYIAGGRYGYLPALIRPLKQVRFLYPQFTNPSFVQILSKVINGLETDFLSVASHMALCKRVVVNLCGGSTIGSNPLSQTIVISKTQ